MKKAAIYTQGCRLNQTESALMADRLEQAGFTVVSWEEDSEIKIINSCSVTGTAAQKMGQLVRSIRKHHPESFIVLAGCGVTSEKDQEKWQQNGLADLVIPNQKKGELADILREALTPALDFHTSSCEQDDLFEEKGVGRYYEKTRANLKIQEGCNFFCSYCIVPYLRGAPRSREWNDILREMGELLQQGYKEIVLTGVNVATYDDHGRDLADLVRELLKFKGDFRLRLSSTEPGEVVRKIAVIMKEDPRLCRFLHLSVQYAENRILKAMNRRYTIEAYRDLLKELTEQIPEICIGSDLIVGFPGEDEESFKTCCEMICQLPLAYIHVFTYSKREGTKAATMPNQVPANVAKQRHEIVRKIVEQKSQKYCEQFINKRVRILTETIEDDMVSGWTDNYIKVEVPMRENVQQNEFYDVKITNYKEERTLRGEWD